MLYVGGSYVIEAVEQGVVRRPLREAFTGAVLAIVVRRRNLTEKQRTDVLEHANKFVLKALPYGRDRRRRVGDEHRQRRRARRNRLPGQSGILCARSLGVGDNARPENADKAFFCSELVARCFELAGRPSSPRSRRSRARA